MASAPVLETFDLRKRFGKTYAVDGVNLAVSSGEIYGLIGPNGSGKTTLIRLCLGLLHPTTGTVRLLGANMPHKAILSKVGYMTQASALYEELTVRENVAFFAKMCGSHEPAWIDEAIALVDLQDRANSVVRTLSGGMRQRTSLACSLAHRPRLLLMDEPTVGCRSPAAGDLLDVLPPPGGLGGVPDRFQSRHGRSGALRPAGFHASGQNSGRGLLR